MAASTSWQSARESKRSSSEGGDASGRLAFAVVEQPTKHDPETVFVAPYHPNTPTFRYTNARYRDNIQRYAKAVY